jgi:HAMP domain-containing protein
VASGFTGDIRRRVLGRTLPSSVLIAKFQNERPSSRLDRFRTRVSLGSMPSPAREPPARLRLVARSYERFMHSSM